MDPFESCRGPFLYDVKTWRFDESFAEARCFRSINDILSRIFSSHAARSAQDLFL